jgi:tetratricopeptide (TPR) repeat protein
VNRLGRTLPNPLPLVNKALALYQWKQDLPGAAALCRDALALDNECDAAVATLAQLSLQQGRIEEAIEMFGRHAGIARTEAELVQALSYENVSADSSNPFTTILIECDTGVPRATGIPEELPRHGGTVGCDGGWDAGSDVSMGGG